MNLRGKHVVVTGKVPDESRSTAEARLRDAGAIIQSAVNARTDVLVTGASVGATKLTKAESLGVQIVPWARVWTTGTESLAPGAAALSAAREAFGERGESVRTIAPMLAKKAERVPAGSGWLHEIKWDGFRCVATVEDGRVTMQSRSAKSEYDESFAEVSAELAKLPNCVLDGELVVLDENGYSSIEQMTNRRGASYVVFDVLELSGSSMRMVPLEDRQQHLAELLQRHPSPRLAQSPVYADGADLFEFVLEKGLEGVVSKQRLSTYREGSRGEAWLKVKVRVTLDAVVIGLTPGKGARAGHVGAFLLGVYDQGELVYVGKVGTGRQLADWDFLWAMLTERDSPPPAFIASTLTMGGPERRSVTWVEPDTVVEVAYQKWTPDGQLWHPSLKRVRDDKKPRAAMRET